MNIRSRDELAESGARIVFNPAPTILLFLSVGLAVLPFGAWFDIGVAPAFPLAVAFYWAVVRPAALPAPIVFAAGLLFDLLSSGPPGMWAFVYLAVYVIASSQTRLAADQSITVLWLGCAGAGLVALLLAWGLGCIYYRQMIPMTDLAIHIGLAVLLFPLFAVLCERMQRSLVITS